MGGTYVPGFGPSHSPLMIVAEAPGRDEEKHDPPRPLVGASGQKTNELLIQNGSSLNNHYRTNVCKYRPPDNDLERLPEIGHSIDEGIPQLWQEIEAINPNCILALGGVSLFHLTGLSGITNYRGSILKTQRYVNGRQIKVVPTIHPANLLPYQRGNRKYDPRAKSYVTLDFKRALDESLSPELNNPVRTLEIARSSAQVYSFFERYKDASLVSIDIETPKCIPVCISFAFNTHHAISIPLINLPDNEFQIPHPELINIWMELRRFFSTNPKIIGQNFKFDHDKLITVCRFPLPKDIYCDTTLMAHILHAELPANLAFLTSIYSREPYYKTEGKEFNPKKDKLERLFTYNAKDAVVTFEVYENMLRDITELGYESFLFNHLVPLHSIYMDIESQGFRVDITRRESLRQKYKDWWKKDQDELSSLIGFEVNVNSPKQVKFLLYQELQIPERKDSGEETLVALLANTVKDTRKRRIIELILEIRRVRRTISSVLNASEDYDGRMRTSYNINGTETGRTSTKKLKSPLRPTKKGIGLNFQNLTKHGDIGQDIREMFIPDEGYEFLEADLSQAEPRIVALLSEDYELLERFARGEDVHSLTTTWIFGLPLELVTKELRFVGKICRNGGNYDMGKHRLMETIMTEGRRAGLTNVNISEWKAGEILERFHKYSPKIRGTFHASIERVLRDRNMSIINPYGRPRLFFDNWDEVRKAAFAHVPSSTVADKVKTIIRSIRKKKKIQILVEAHDALLFQSRIEERQENVEIIKEAFEEPISFERCSIPRGSLRIPCEISMGMDYKNLVTIYKGK